MNEFVCGPFKSKLFFPLCPIAFLGVFPIVVSSQQSQILWHLSWLCWVQELLIALVLLCSAPPLLQGRLHTLRLHRSSWRWHFLSPERNFCLFYLSQHCPLLWGFFLSSFRFCLRGNYSKSSCKLVVSMGVWWVQSPPTPPSWHWILICYF